MWSPVARGKRSTVSDRRTAKLLPLFQPWASCVGIRVLSFVFESFWRKDRLDRELPLDCLPTQSIRRRRSGEYFFFNGGGCCRIEALGHEHSVALFFNDNRSVFGGPNVTAR